MLRSDLIAGLLTVFLLALIWTVPFVPDHSWGWDESMHAALPAAKILTELEAGEPVRALEIVVRDCQQYPFVYPTFLALVQGVFGLSEAVTRVAGRLLFCFGLFGLFLLAGEVVRTLRSQSGFENERSATRIAFGAIAFGVLCPLAFAYSGTLFQEVPFLVAEVFCLRAWLRRSRSEVAAPLCADLAVGCWLTVCFFTKFNYACLLVAALGLDLLVQAWSAKRAGALTPFAIRILRMAAPFVLALAWWFVLPLPGGLELGAQHREVFLSFMRGNLEFAERDWSRQILHWTAAFVPTARFGLLVALGLLLSLAQWRNGAVRLLWIVLLGMGLPIAFHPFHLDRFLIPLGPPIWILAAVGLGGFAQSLVKRVPSRAARWAFGIMVLAGCLVSPERDSRFMAKRVGLWNEEQRDYLTWLLASWRDLSPNRRLPTAGLRTEAADRFHDLIATELKPNERFGWIGISSELAPAALQLGAFEHGQLLERFRRDAGRQLWLDFGGADPGWKAEQFRKWAGQFGVIFFTDPPDLKARKGREWTAAYAERLRAELGWSRKELGTVSIERPHSEPIVVTLFACRPPL